MTALGALQGLIPSFEPSCPLTPIRGSWWAGVVVAALREATKDPVR